MLFPIATVLTRLSSDVRTAPSVRDRSIATLQLLTSKVCLSLAVSADWGIICEAFLRQMDALDKDIAMSAAQISQFIYTVETLFLKGFLFHGGQPSAPKTVKSSGDAVLNHKATHGMPHSILEATSRGHQPGFITSRMEKILRHRAVFHAGTQPSLLWGPCSSADLQEVASRAHNAAKLLTERLRAEFPRDLRHAFCCFDVVGARIAVFGNAGNKDGSDSTA